MLYILTPHYSLFFMFCRFSDHEREVGQVAMEMGFTHVSTSSDVMPMVRVVPRGYTGTQRTHREFVST